MPQPQPLFERKEEDEQGVLLTLAAIVKIASSTAGLRPILSPMAPNSMPPMGRKKTAQGSSFRLMRKPERRRLHLHAIQKTTNVSISANIGSSPGKKLSEKLSAKYPNTAKSNHSKMLPLAPSRHTLILAWCSGSTPKRLPSHATTRLVLLLAGRPPSAKTIASASRCRPSVRDMRTEQAGACARSRSRSLVELS